MFKIHVLGMGPGTKQFISPIIISHIKNADVIIGGKRHFQEVQEEIKNKEQIAITSDLEGLVTYIKNNRNKKIAILVSGDPGFYSFLVFLNKHFSKDELEVIPGLSSMQYMFCKVALSWQDAEIKSLHGKEFDFIKALKEKSIVGMLTDSKNTPQYIAQIIVEKGFPQTKVYVGENLSYKEEKITLLRAIDLTKIERKFEMNVVILEKVNDVSY